MKKARAEKGSLKAFLRRTRKKHGDKFDYSRILSINSLKDEFEIGCRKHGFFKQRLEGHISSKYGCPKCGRENMRFSKACVLQKFRDRHGDKYDYSKVENWRNYDKIEIGCRNCGQDFSQVVRSHYRGSGCPECKKGGKLDTEEFVRKGRGRHGEQFGYSKTIYTRTKDPLVIYCRACSKFFATLPQTHLRKAGHGGCKFCGMSEGEKRIFQLLEGKNIKFEFQKRFEDCRLTYPLPFDFYLEGENLAIEYHGIQHYFIKETRSRRRDVFRLNLKRDGIKRRFCRDNSITLEVVNRYNEGRLSSLLHFGSRNID